MLPTERPKQPLVRRTTNALQTVAEVVVPTALVGAGYLVVGGHWEALKSALAGWGIPPNTTALAAPLVAILVALGIRHMIRLVNSRPESIADDEPEQP